MIYYLILVMVLTILNLVLTKRKFIYVSLIILTIFVGFRPLTVGLSDTLNYHIPLFKIIRNYSYKELAFMYSFKDGYLYIYYVKIIASITKNTRIFLLISLVPFTIGMINIVKKASVNPFITIIIAISTFYFYSFFLVRQYMAFGFILLALSSIIGKKYASFFIFMFIAFFIHPSSFVFIIVFPIFIVPKINNGILFVLTLLVSLTLVKFDYILLEIISKIFPSYYFYLQHEIYTLGEYLPIISIIIYSSTVILYLFYKTKSIVHNKLLSILIIGIGLLILSKTIVEFYRIGLYFLSVNSLLLANINYNSTTKKVIKFSIAFLYLLYMLISLIPNINGYYN